MDAGEWVATGLPISSGVTEAACKVIVKQRLCGSGMKGKQPGAAAVLSVRCLTYTTERWSQFWSKIDRSGFPVDDAASCYRCGVRNPCDAHQSDVKPWSNPSGVPHHGARG